MTNPSVSRPQRDEAFPVLTPAQIARLDAASAKQRIYPYWHQAQFAERNPFPTS